MKNVLYAVSDLHEWVVVAKELEKKYDWKPKYWLTVPSLHAEVVNNFPTIKAEEFFKISKLQNISEELSIDEITEVSDFTDCFWNANLMLDRYDIFNSFSSVERRDYIYDQFALWSNIFVKNSIDILFLTEAPHSIAQYLLYCLAKKLEKQVILFKPTHYCSLTFISDSITNNNLDLYKCHKNQTISNSLNEKINSIKNNDYKKNIPWYFKTQNSIFYDISKKVKSLFKIKKDTYLKKRNKKISTSEWRYFEIGLLKIKAYIYKRWLKKKYDDLCVDFKEIQRPYLFLPLHYQPEKTTCPEGGVYSDQQLIVKLLSGLIPTDWVVIVKEHPKQFSKSTKGEQGRNKDYYNNLKKYDNVKFVKTGTNQYDLIDRAKAVVTITGSVGIEAVIRGIPTIVFGNPWYTSCPGVYPVDKEKGIKEIINELVNNKVKFSNDNVQAFFMNLESYSKPIYLNPSSKYSDTEISEKENLRNILKLIDLFIENNVTN